MACLAKASKCLSSAEKRIPFDNIPGASFTVADSTYHEGIEFAALLMRLGKETATEKPQTCEVAASCHERERPTVATLLCRPPSGKTDSPIQRIAATHPDVARHRFSS